MDYPGTVQAVGILVAANVPVILWGPPGVGKTSVVQGIAFNFNLWLETVIASNRDPSDFLGMPNRFNGEMVYDPPSWAKRVVRKAVPKSEGGEGQISVVFYDEISTAQPSVQAALLRPILEGVVGEVTLPSQTRSIAAANPPDIAAGGWDITPPVANRFVHLDWNLPASVVREGFTKGWQPIDIPRLPSRAVQDKNMQAALAIVGSFIGSRPELVVALPNDASGNASSRKVFAASDYAFPTPRAWETVAKLYAAARSARFKSGQKVSESVISILLQGTVGVAAATEFLEFAKSLSLPDPEKLLSGTASFDLPSRGDELFVVMSSLLHAYRDTPTKERWMTWGDLLTKTATSTYADVALIFAKDWLKYRPENAVISSRHRKAFEPLFAELDPDKEW